MGGRHIVTQNNVKKKKKVIQLTLIEELLYSTVLITLGNLKCSKEINFD